MQEEALKHILKEVGIDGRLGVRFMKVALVVNKIDKLIKENVNKIIEYINMAADKNADLVLFSETALTGLINDDNPEHDIELGICIQGDIINEICQIAKNRGINIALGIFEKEEKNLYDSAIFINRNGEIGMKYRRITNGWHNPSIKDSVYKEGNELITYNSDIGNVCFLICGDLFDEDLVSRARLLDADILLFPFARSFYDGSFDQSRWENEELESYVEQIKKTNKITLGVNYLSEEYFGGAFIVTGEGKLLSDIKLGQEGMLMYDF